MKIKSPSRPTENIAHKNLHREVFTRINRHIDNSVTDLVHACQSCQRRSRQLAKWWPVQINPLDWFPSPGRLCGLTHTKIPTARPIHPWEVSQGDRRTCSTADCAYAIKVRGTFLAHREGLASYLQGNLDGIASACLILKLLARRPPLAGFLLPLTRCCRL
jgi:hypothetical protein